MFLAFSAKADHGMFYPGFTQPFATIIPSAYLLQLFRHVLWGCCFPGRRDASLTTEDDARNFLEKHLGMDRSVMESIQIESVRPVTDRKGGRLFRRKATKATAIVQFAQIEDRDAVFTYAPDLKNGSNLDLVVPNHLTLSLIHI